MYIDIKDKKIVEVELSSNKEALSLETLGETLTDTMLELIDPSELDNDTLEMRKKVLPMISYIAEPFLLRMHESRLINDSELKLIQIEPDIRTLIIYSILFGYILNETFSQMNIKITSKEQDIDESAIPNLNSISKLESLIQMLVESGVPKKFILDTLDEAGIDKEDPFYIRIVKNLLEV